MKFAFLAAAAALSFVNIPATKAASLHRSYAYYTISGNTAADLDRELRRSGPYLESDQEHHAAAAKMRFDTIVRYGLTHGTCRIVSADVRLRVTITLPRWKTLRPPDDPYLLVVWNVLSKDIRRHEEHHVAIAHRHADRLERTLRRLRPTKGCDALKHKVEQATRAELKKDDVDQRAFDRAEQANFEVRFSRLLRERMRELGR